MQCPKCKDPQGFKTGTLELVRAFTLTVNDDGFPGAQTAIVLDEYLSCTSCKDLKCSQEECVVWHWEALENGTQRIVLG